MRRIGVILSGELKNLVREPELSFLLLVPFLIGLLLRLAIPPATDFLQSEFGFAAEAHLPFVLGYMMLVPPLLCGMVVGLRLLDDRDGGVLDYIAVTPLTESGYLAARLALPGILSVPLAAMLPFIAGRPPEAPLPMLLAAAAGGLNAPLLTLFLVTFAGNKVEAMALAKVSGILFLAPLAGYIWDSPWTAPAALFPPYWTPLAVAAAGKGGAWVRLIAGAFTVQFFWLALFWVLFRRRRRT